MKQKFTIFLQNVDDSITKLKLKHGLSISSLSQPDAYKFVKNLERCSINEAGRKIAIESHVFNYVTKKICFIDKELEDLNNQDVANGGILGIAGKFQREIIFPYIEPLLTSLRLFKEGDIAYWNYYFYEPHKGSAIMSFSNMQSRIIYNKTYSLLDNEIENCNKFINDFVLPTSKHLKLAIEQFNNSYFAVSLESAFLNLMISLEALYTKNNQELSFRFARNCAILLGTNYGNSQIIFHDIKELYIKRNKLIHGKTELGEITQEDVYKCREYVRNSIKKFIELKEGHEGLLNKLDTFGFGQLIEG
jgi:hypothetical protein